MRESRVSNYYTGIGSRKTPEDVLFSMFCIAKELGDRGMTLRSGGADGADAAFERGAREADIMLPWQGFNSHSSNLYVPDHYQRRISGYGKTLNRAVKTAEHIHPRWDNLTDSGRRMHIRNVWQVMGTEMSYLSRFVVCWTPNGEEVGGTATAIRLAKQIGVPVFNLATMSEDAVMDAANEIIVGAL